MRLMRCFRLCVAGITFLALASSAGAQREVLAWRTFMIPDFGTSIEYPASILSPSANQKGAWDSVSSADLIYREEEKRAWDAVVTRISLSLRPLE
jgi:hypothetical protein